MSAATVYLNSNTDPAASLPPGTGAAVTVDLAALVENWRSLGRHVGPGCIVAGVVKADGYGTGMIPAGEALARAGCRWFFVATPEEGIALAEALAPLSPLARVAVLSGPLPGAAAELARLRTLVPVLNDLGQIATWGQAAPGRPAILHLDTGMSRLGLPEHEVARLAAEPELLRDVPLAGVMSHLACADEAENPLNEIQRARFAAASAILPPAPRSLAASFGTYLGPQFHFDMIRAGAALYGINPTPGQPNPLRQVVGIKARIVQVREIDQGATVGYGATYVADRPRRVATLALGYADGILRMAGNRARCHIGPYEAPVIGRISMDFITVDLSAVPPELARPGDFADLAGPHHDIDALARDCDTLGYELLTRLGPRLHRLYRPDREPDSRTDAA